MLERAHLLIITFPFSGRKGLDFIRIAVLFVLFFCWLNYHKKSANSLANQLQWSLHSRPRLSKL